MVHLTENFICVIHIITPRKVHKGTYLPDQHLDWAYWSSEFFIIVDKLVRIAQHWYKECRTSPCFPSNLFLNVYSTSATLSLLAQHLTVIFATISICTHTSKFTH